MALTLPKTTSSQVDLQDPQVREYLYQQLGIEEPKPKASFLERVGSLLSFTETGNAAYKLVKTGDPLKALQTYGADAFKGVTGAITGDVDKEKKTYSNVLKELGIDNNLVSGVGGLALDIGLDPFTYLSAGTKAGVKVGGKTLTSKGAKVLNKAKFRAATDIAGELGIKIGKNNLDEVTDLLRKAPEEDFLKAVNKLASKAGIELVTPVTDIKLVPQVLEAFGKKRMNKIFKLTGANLVKEVDSIGAKGVQEVGELFAKPTLRFAGKDLFTLTGSQDNIAKLVVDPVQLGLETAAKSNTLKPIFSKFKGLVNTFKDSGRNLFDTTYSAEQVGLKNLDAGVKQLFNYVDNIMGQTGKSSDEVMKVMDDIVDSPHLLPELMERTSWLDEGMGDLKKFYTKQDNIADNSILRFFGVKNALKDANLKQKSEAFIKAWDARDIDTLNKIASSVPSNKRLGKVMKSKIDNAAKHNFKWMGIAGHYELNEDLGIARLVKELQGDKSSDLLPFINNAKIRQQKLSELGTRNINDHITRHATAKAGESFDSKGYIMPNKIKSTYDSDKILGSRSYEFIAQGRSEGEITYAIDEVMKGRKWEALSKAEQKKARAEITSLIVETEVKFQVAEAYHHFLTYIKKAGEWDDGGSLLAKLEGLDGKAIEELRKQGYREVKRTGKMLDGYLAPPEVANMLENTYKTLFDPDQTNGFLKAFDKVTGMWKQSVTSWFPAFHIRNGMSNIFANAMAGLKNPKKYTDAREVQKYMNLSAKHGVSKKALIEAGNKKIGNYTIAEIVSFAEQHSVVGAGSYFTEIADGLAKSRPGQVNRINPLSKDFALTKIGSTVGNYVEGNAKLALFIDQLDKGQTIEESANMVKKVLFDYGDLTDFEKNTMRRVIPFYCVPTDTEILTQKGWKKYDEINTDTTAMTFNINNKELEWQQVEDVAVFDFDGELERLQQGKYDFLYTEDHRFPIYNYKDELSIIRAYDFNTGHKIPLTGNYTSDKDIMGTRLAAVIGWAVTDGYMRMRGNHLEIVLYQTKKKYLDEILELLGDDCTVGNPHPDTGTYPIYVHANITREISKFINSKQDIDSIVGKLSKAEAEAMWNSMFKADGSSRLDKSYQFFAQTRPSVINAFQILTLMLGKTANIGKRGCYIKTRNKLQIANTKRTKQKYTGKIWCPKTKNSTWIMRRNGAVMITGNTWTRKNAEFMTRYALANPGKFGAILKGYRDIKTSISDLPEEDIEKLPTWARAGFSVITGSGTNASAITGFGTPIEAFGDFMDSFTNAKTRTFLNFIGPIPRGVIEKSTGISLFTGKEIKNDTDGKKFRQLPGFMKDAIGYKEIERTTKDGNKYMEYIINPHMKWTLNMFLGRGINETSKMLETIDDPSAIQVLNFLTGIKRYEFNTDEEQVKRERESAQILLDILISEGMGKEYTIGGLTKEAKLDLGLTQPEQTTGLTLR